MILKTQMCSIIHFNILKFIKIQQIFNLKIIYTGSLGLKLKFPRKHKIVHSKIYTELIYI
jgi:hypothetical protein